MEAMYGSSFASHPESPENTSPRARGSRMAVIATSAIAPAANAPIRRSASPGLTRSAPGAARTRSGVAVASAIAAAASAISAGCMNDGYRWLKARPCAATCGRASSASAAAAPANAGAPDPTSARRRAAGRGSAIAAPISTIAATAA